MLVCLKITFADDMHRAETTLVSGGSTGSQLHSRKGSRGVPAWQVGSRAHLQPGSEAIASSSGTDAYALKPIKVETVTEQWYDREGDQLDDGYVLHLTNKRDSHFAEAV